MNGPPWIHCITGAGASPSGGAEPGVDARTVRRRDVELDQLARQVRHGRRGGQPLGVLVGERRIQAHRRRRAVDRRAQREQAGLRCGQRLVYAASATSRRTTRRRRVDDDHRPAPVQLARDVQRARVRRPGPLRGCRSPSSTSVGAPLAVSATASRISGGLLEAALPLVLERDPRAVGRDHRRGELVAVLVGEHAVPAGGGVDEQHGVRAAAVGPARAPGDRRRRAVGADRPRRRVQLALGFGQQVGRARPRRGRAAAAAPCSSPSSWSQYRIGMPVCRIADHLAVLAGRRGARRRRRRSSTPAGCRRAAPRRCRARRRDRTRPPGRAASSSASPCGRQRPQRRGVLDRAGAGTGRGEQQPPVGQEGRRALALLRPGQPRPARRRPAAPPTARARTSPACRPGASTVATSRLPSVARRPGR